MKKKQKPVIEHLTIDDFAAEGKALGRVNGKVIFVEKVVPGDVVDVRLLKNKKDWGEGVPIRFHKYSSRRIQPFCQHFGVCGGCQWQMISYEDQLLYKERQVREIFRRIGKIDIPEIMPIIGAEQDKYYRNKLEYTFSNSEFIPAEQFSRELQSEEKGNGAAGFHARGFFDKVVEIETCYLQPEPTNLIRNTIAEFGRQHGYAFYDHRSHSGLLRNAMVRTSTLGQVMLNIVFGHDDKQRINDLLGFLLKQIPGITTLLYTINTKVNDSIHDLQPTVYHGPGFIEERMEDFIFKIGPKSFYQTNSRQGERLYAVAREFAELKGDEHLYDLYCGTGSIGIFCSRHAASVVGIELIAEAIDDARENAQLNNIGHAKFFAGDVSKLMTKEFMQQNGSPDVIITDPPRAGMHQDLVKTILEVEAPRVVYVSCNPATQARDLALLSEKYDVTRIQPVDMFPQTMHIENVVQLKLK